MKYLVINRSTSKNICLSFSLNFILCMNDMDGILALVALLVLLLAFSLLFYQLRTGVPPFPATRSEVKAVSQLLKKGGVLDHALIYELGSGWGDLVLELSRAFPHAKIIGIEVSWLPYFVSRYRTRNERNVTIIHANFYQVDIRDADAAVAYLMIEPMNTLAKKLDQDLKIETPVVSLAFFFRDREPAAIIPGRGLFRAAAALYRWPAKEQE